MHEERSLRDFEKRSEIERIESVEQILKVLLIYQQDREEKLSECSLHGMVDAAPLEVPP